jgi:hypothetical protein
LGHQVSNLFFEVGGRAVCQGTMAKVVLAVLILGWDLGVAGIHSFVVVHSLRRLAPPSRTHFAHVGQVVAREATFQKMTAK